MTAIDLLAVPLPLDLVHCHDLANASAKHEHVSRRSMWLGLTTIEHDSTCNDVDLESRAGSRIILSYECVGRHRWPKL